MNRRDFVGISGSSLALGLESSASGERRGSRSALRSGGLRSDVRKLIQRTPLVDTHEHLPREADRIAQLGAAAPTVATDFGLLMSHYTDADLQVAGMSVDDYRRLTAPGLQPTEKWDLVAPFYERCRHTGFQICVRETVRALFGENDIRRENCDTISRRLRDGVVPGFYRRILRDVANIEHAQVNCTETPIFRESEPATDLLSFDLWTIAIASGAVPAVLDYAAGSPVTTLKEAHAAIDRAFSRFGPRAIAVKDQSAYWRRLDFDEVKDVDAAPLFDRFRRNAQSLTAAERRAIQNNLFRHCLRRATEMRLPVKIHTGYAAGQGAMDLSRVRDNMNDMARLAREFPDTRFVLLHIGYPYQNELIALCKQYRNIYADMCWAWIIDPSSAVRFVQEFLMAAPACKLFTFGGDFVPVELVAGHARMARHGLGLALSHLVEEGWLEERDLPALIDRIMRGNARETYDLARVLQAYG